MNVDGFFQIRQNHIIIDGVKGEHRFIHISDTHISCFDELSTKDEKAKAIAQEAAWQAVKRDFARHFGDRFGSEQDIPSTKAFKKLITYAAKQNPEALLMSGDIVDYIHPAGLRFVKKVLDDADLRYLFANGNHEGGFETHPELKCLNNDCEDIAVYYGEGFIIAALDNSTKTVNDRQFLQLKELFLQKVPVILLMHIPLSTEYNREDMQCFSEYFLMKDTTDDNNAKRFIDMLISPDSPVKAILCGHVHGYHVGEFAKGKMQICASSGMVGCINELIICDK